MHPDDDLPRPARPRIERTSPLRDGVLLGGLIVVVIAGTALYRSAMETITPGMTAATGISAPNETSLTASPALPPELIQMAIAISTSLAPTPTPLAPTPTYAMQPTPKLPDVCLTSTPRGSVCTQPLPPLPTSTPMAACPVSPGALCVWDGGPVTWLSPTPSAERTGTGGVNSQ